MKLIHLIIHLTTIHPFMSIHHPYMHPTIHLPFYPFFHPSIHLSIHLSIFPSILPSMLPSIHYPSIHPSVHPRTHPYIPFLDSVIFLSIISCFLNAFFPFSPFLFAVSLSLSIPPFLPINTYLNTGQTLLTQLIGDHS